MLFPPAFSQDGHFLALCWTNRILQVWDPSQRILLHQLTNATGRVWALSFLADGRKLLTWSASGNLIHEWDLATGLEIQSWRAPEVFSVVALTTDERSALAIGWEGDIVFRNLVDKSQTKLNLYALETDFGCFSPDGKLFAAASALGHARVWDTATWQPVATSGGFLNGVHGVSFSPDGKRLAIDASYKEAVRLCDTESWQDVFTLEGQGHESQGIGFSRMAIPLCGGTTPPFTSGARRRGRTSSRRRRGKKRRLHGSEPISRRTPLGSGPDETRRRARRVA